MKTHEQKMSLTSIRHGNLTTMLFVCLSLCLLFAGQARAQTCTPSVGTSRTAVHAKPTAPTLPAAGGKFCDPTFGTKIMRVTDEVSVPVGGAGTSYSYWATFNSDNSRLLVMEVGAQQLGRIYEFNPTTFTLGQRLAPVPYPPNAAPIRLDDAVWAYGDPDKLFVHTDNGTKIYSYKVSTQTYTLIKDLSGYLPAGQFVQQMSVAQDDDTFSFGINLGGNPTYGDAGYIVYRDSTDTVLAQSAVGVNEVRLDKTGRYLFVNTNNQGAGQIEVQIVDLNTQQVQNLTDDAPDHAPSHYDVGSGMAVGNGNYLLGISARSLSNPHSFTEILDLTNEGNYGGFHLSMLADNELWTLVSFYTEHLNNVMEDELVQVSTDGSQRVRRLAHHQSIFTGDYYQSPRANISRDGRFVAFSSNWGGRNRNDLFIVEIPPAPTQAPAGEVVWVEDGVPAGSTTASDNDGWNWVSSNPAPYSGVSAHQSSIYGGWHQHFFYNATSTLTVNPGD